MGNTIPRGFGFHPSDEDLLSHFLKKKNQGTDSKITAIIPVIVVCDYEPNEIPALIRKAVRETEWPAIAESMKMWHFFSPRHYKYTNNSSSGQSNRTTKGGFWKSTGKPRVIKAHKSKDAIGEKRILTFHEYVEGKTKRTDWVIHEYYHIEAVSGKQIGDFVLYCLKNKSDDLSSFGMVSTVENQAASALEGVVTGEQGSLELPQNMVVDDQADNCGCGDFNPFDFEDAPDDMFTEAEINLLSKNLGDAQGSKKKLRGSTTDSCPLDENGLSNCPEKQTETCKSAVDHMIEELLSEPGNLDSVFRVPQSPQPHQQQEYPTLLQSPMSTKLGNVSRNTTVHEDESRKRKSPFKDNNPSLAAKNKIPTNELPSTTTFNSLFDDASGIPEGYTQLGEDPGFHSIPSQYYYLLSVDGEQGDFPIDNNFIELDDLPSPFDDINPLEMFSDRDTDTGGGAVITEAIQGSVNSNSALATIGASLQCS